QRSEIRNGSKKLPMRQRVTFHLLQRYMVIAVLASQVRLLGSPMGVLILQGLVFTLSMKVMGLEVYCFSTWWKRFKAMLVTMSHYLQGVIIRPSETMKKLAFKS